MIKQAEIQRLNKISGQVIGACIEVHRRLGPGLLESVYEKCLCHELDIAGIPYRCQVQIPVEYKGLHFDNGYRLDLLVANSVIVELTSVDEMLPIYEAQLLTYMKLTNLKLGLLVNFNVQVLKEGITRRANFYSTPEEAQRISEIEAQDATDMRRSVDKNTSSLCAFSVSPYLCVFL